MLSLYNIFDHQLDCELRECRDSVCLFIVLFWACGTVFTRDGVERMLVNASWWCGMHDASNSQILPQ